MDKKTIDKIAQVFPETKTISTSSECRRYGICTPAFVGVKTLFKRKCPFLLVSARFSGETRELRVYENTILFQVKCVGT